MLLVEASLHCDLNCRYCYNRDLRARGHDLPNLSAMEEAIRRLLPKPGGSITLHGGEPLSWPLYALERIFALGRELGASLSVQTNGLSLRKEHIELFKKYRVGIGLSIDGPWPLNRFRANEAQTKRILGNIETLVENNLPPGLIVVISRANGVPSEREQFKEFLVWCRDRRINGRMNPCISEDPEVALTTRELAEFYLDILEFSLREPLPPWSPYRDLAASLRGEERTVCFLRPCFPYHTPSGMVITPRGEVSVCHKFHEDVILNVLRHYGVREEVLAQTDCKGCSYFGWACYGGCPASARGGDWRNKDRFCPVWRALFRRLEAEMTLCGQQVARPRASPK